MVKEREEIRCQYCDRVTMARDEVCSECHAKKENPDLEYTPIEKPLSLEDCFAPTCTGPLIGLVRGMTLLDWFAGMAMQGVLANPNSRFGDLKTEQFYNDAEAMLAEKKKREGE